MTVTLAIDTASELLSLALSYENKIESIQLKVGNELSENILIEIGKLFEKAAIKKSQLDLIGYNQGPGSFTGLRIGASVAAAMAYALQIKLYPVNTFELFAYANSPNTYKIVTIDARLNQIYLAGINNQTHKYFIQPQLVNPSDISEIILNSIINIPKHDICVISNGIAVYKDVIDSSLFKGFHMIAADHPPATIMLDIIKSQVTRHTHNAEQIDLLYLRDKVALNLNEQQQLKQGK